MLMIFFIQHLSLLIFYLDFHATAHKIEVAAAAAFAALYACFIYPTLMHGATCFHRFAVVSVAYEIGSACFSSGDRTSKISEDFFKVTHMAHSSFYRRCHQIVNPLQSVRF